MELGWSQGLVWTGVGVRVRFRLEVRVVFVQCIECFGDPNTHIFVVCCPYLKMPACCLLHKKRLSFCRALFRDASLAPWEQCMLVSRKGWSLGLVSGLRVCTLPLTCAIGQDGRLDRKTTYCIISCSFFSCDFAFYHSGKRNYNQTISKL